jgi:hypothetical protein
MSPEQRLVELGIELPEPLELPLAPRLRPVVVHDRLAYLSGNGDLGCLGRVGDDVDVEQAALAARTTAHRGDERGVCARSAIGVAELPNGLAVEIEAVVAL